MAPIGCSLEPAFRMRPSAHRRPQLIRVFDRPKEPRYPIDGEGLRFVLRHLPKPLGLLLLSGALLLVAAEACLAFRQAVPSHTGGS